MILYPEVQRKAQAELDSVIGMSQLPSFEDRESLPYVNDLCKEVLRWHPVLPLGIAHRVMQDDIYGDYLIPSGSLVIGNAWYVQSRIGEAAVILVKSDRVSLSQGNAS
jgi:cytochrome P450